ncbi:hypothetical protein T01_416 [Trichinella spiralis]|uniref:Uncharacterized protein n=1 Tax=Trichinella spiralis TaxID=6334 RepID=A0A0V1AN87_TRISP|nr:hypothetical protein T01_3600 [Trichinella spiralis]KRY26292.1 hypothetical protein T01_416 [Trichinella spiralis]
MLSAFIMDRLEMGMCVATMRFLLDYFHQSGSEDQNITNKTAGHSSLMLVDCISGLLLQGRECPMRWTIRLIRRQLLVWYYSVPLFSYWSLPTLFYWTVKSLSYWFSFYWAVKSLSYWFSLSNCSLIQTLQL